MKRKGLRIPEVLTASEQEALLAQPNPRYPTGMRNYTMLRLMLDTGLRLSEAVNLKWRDVDFNTGKLMVRQGKGAKDRILWIGDADLELLRAWRERQAKDVNGNPEHVFTTLAGKPVSPRYVQQMVKRAVADFCEYPIERMTGGIDGLPRNQHGHDRCFSGAGGHFQGQTQKFGIGLAVGIFKMFQKSFSCLPYFRGDLCQVNDRFNGFNLAEEGANAVEMVMPPVLKKASRFRCDAPVVWVGEIAPLVYILPDLVDNGGWIVLLFFRGQPFAVPKDHFTLHSFFRFSFFIFRCLARSPAFSGATRQFGIASSVASLLPRNDRGKVYQRDPDSLVEIINSKS